MSKGWLTVKILVVDDLAVVREAVGAALRCAGHEVVILAAGKAAQTRIRREKFDLLLLDLGLPDISGFALLTALRKEPSTAQLPVLLLTSDEDKSSILAAARLGIQGYLLKSGFSMRDLLARIERHDLNARAADTPGSAQPNPVGVGDAPQLLTRDQFLKRIKAGLKTRTLSGVVTEVIALAASPRAEISDLADVVSKDALLATRVLQTANSAAFRSARGMLTTIPEAIRQIGCGRIRNIAAAIGIFQSMPDTAKDGFNLLRSWQHSFAVAQLCETFASGQNSGLAYLVGLCHDLGEIALRTLLATEYEQLLAFERASSCSRAELEERMLGMPRTALIAAIHDEFALPAAVRKPIEWFHANPAALSPGTAGGLEGTLRIAEWYANGALLASSECADVSYLSEAELKQTVGARALPRIDMQQFRSEIAALCQMLAKLSPQQESELLKPLLPRTDASIWVAHGPDRPAFDAVSEVIAGLCRAAVHDRLPAETELTKLDGLVLIGDDDFRNRNAAEFKARSPHMPTLQIAPFQSASKGSAVCPIQLRLLQQFCSSTKSEVAREAA